jgi:carbonyl reductase 1
MISTNQERGLNVKPQNSFESAIFSYHVCTPKKHKPQNLELRSSVIHTIPDLLTAISFITSITIIMSSSVAATAAAAATAVAGAASSSIARRIALVTGANKGLGFHVASQLMAQTHTPLHVVLTSRDESRGKTAFDKIKSVHANNEHNSCSILPLDVTDSKSIEQCVSAVKDSFGSIDILVNNAGYMSNNGFNLEIVKKTLDVNYYGLLNVTRAFLPMLNTHGRIVNVASQLGSSALRDFSPQKQQAIMNAKTEAEVTALMDEYVANVADGTHEQNGFPSVAYGTSKAGVIALSRVLATEIKIDNVVVSSVCPGWCRTDMGGTTAFRSSDQGAESIVFQCFLPDDAANGTFWSDKKQVSVLKSA